MVKEKIDFSEEETSAFLAKEYKWNITQRTSDYSDIRVEFIGTDNEAMALANRLKEEFTGIELVSMDKLEEKPAQKQIGGVVTCPNCGSGCYDNSKNKKFPNSADYRCKSKECGYGAWIRNGELSWSAPKKPDWSK